jgi:cell division protein FtsW
MKKNTFFFILSIIIISIFGVIMVYSASYVWANYKFHDSFKYVKNQSLFLIIGLILMFLISKIDYKIYQKHSIKIFLVSLLLLILVLIFGTERNGSKSWFGIGSFGVQPSEFMKLALIMTTSNILSQNKLNNKSIFKILFLALLVFFLIMLQPDFGTGVIILMGIMGLLFAAGTKMSFFGKLGVLGITGFIALIISAPYRIKRIFAFLNPWSDPLGSGFQIIQSLYAIGPGGLLGFGLGASRQKHFYLPEPQTDFIFSIISEEFGFLGVLLVSSLFMVIIICGIKIALNCNNLFGKFLVFGIIFELAFQTILNLMVVVGLIPVTGVTLPFLSYGGSSLMITLMSMGIILSVSKNSN